MVTYMSLRSTKDIKFSVKELCQLAILGAIIFAGKFICASLPNIHPVCLLIIAVSLVYRIKALYAVAVYVALEILVYGFGIWNIAYLYIWPLLSLMVLLFSDSDSSWIWAEVLLIN